MLVRALEWVAELVVTEQLERAVTLVASAARLRQEHGLNRMAWENGLLDG
jgi:hypothetical protein